MVEYPTTQLKRNFRQEAKKQLYSSERLERLTAVVDNPNNSYDAVRLAEVRSLARELTELFALNLQQMQDIELTLEAIAENLDT